MLAISEAELIINGPIPAINQMLRERHPNRSLESIKGQRRKLEYKQLVTHHLAILSSRPGSQRPPTGAQDPSVGSETAEGEGGATRWKQLRHSINIDWHSCYRN